MLLVGGAVEGNRRAAERAEQAERERLAAMTPEEREAEAKAKADAEAERQRIAAEAEAKREEMRNQRAAEAAAKELTMAKYNSIRTGMSEADVAGILGGPGEELSSNRFGQGTQFDVATRLLQWSQGIKNIHVTFQNGKVVQKAQFGL